MTHTEFKEIRTKAGLTQTEMAKKLYKTRDSIAKYESGKFNIPAYMKTLLEATFGV